MDKKKPWVAKKNNSILNASPKLLQALKEVQWNQSGTVQYFFVNQRIRFTKKFPKGEYYKEISILSSPINPQSFYESVKGKVRKKSLEEFLNMFITTQNDNGASYFIISS